MFCMDAEALMPSGAAVAGAVIAPIVKSVFGEAHGVTSTACRTMTAPAVLNRGISVPAPPGSMGASQPLISPGKASVVPALVSYAKTTPKLTDSVLSASALRISQTAVPAPLVRVTGATPTVCPAIDSEVVAGASVPPIPLLSADTRRAFSDVSVPFGDGEIVTKTFTPLGTPVNCAISRVGVSARPACARSPPKVGFTNPDSVK